MKNFWTQLPQPFFALAPMEDVTDVAFRQMFVRYKKPDVMFTEFTAADALVHPEGRDRVDHRLLFEENEHPIVAQIFSADGGHMRAAAQQCATRGFDGIDLNMGCPVKNIQKQGVGAAMIKTPDVACAMIAAARAGAGDIPVSVKTRIGYDEVEIDTWIRKLLEQKLSALTVHLRTRKSMSKVSAQWELMPAIIALRDAIAPDTLIIGNGDVHSIQEAREKCATYGCDGVMIARGVYGTPWFFDPHAAPSVTERLQALVTHAQLYEQYFFAPHDGHDWRSGKNFAIMKKHVKAYAYGFDGATVLRRELMTAESAHDVEKTIAAFFAQEQDAAQ